MKDNSHKRHIAKAVTWRIIGTLDTILLSWLITENPFTGLKIGIAEVITKMGLYYLHERLWFKTRFANSNKRHLLKTFTWRILGTLDTMTLAWIISGNPLTGVKIGMAEMITKMILYFFHEKVWYRIDYGLGSRKSITERNE